MRRLSPEELKHRLQLDYRVCKYMFGSLFNGEAYRTSADLENRRNPITSVNEGYMAKKYRVDFYIKTLMGPGQFSNLTTIGFDLDVAHYPFHEPVTWLTSPQTPYSPHFRYGSPVCIGEIWQRSNGRMLLGQLLVHIARLLNWDEIARGGGYEGWNRDAIAYHQHVYKGRPITEGLQVPVLPPDIFGLTPGPTAPGNPLFRPKQPPPLDNSLFRGKGRA